MTCPWRALDKWRRWTAAVCALALGAAIAGLSAIRIENTGLAFIPDSREDLKAASALLASAPGANMLFIDIEGDDPLGAAAAIERAAPPDLAVSIGGSLRQITPEALVRAFPFFFTPELERRLEERLAGGGLDLLLKSDLSLLQGFGALFAPEWVAGDPLRLRDLLRDSLPVSARSFNKSISADGRHALLTLLPAATAFNTAASARLLKIIQEAAPSDHKLIMSGAPVYTAANAEAVEGDLIRIITLSLAGFALAYVFIARSWGAAWILFTAVMSTICAITAAGFFWPAASGIAIGFGASLMGLSEDYAVHMHFALRSGDGQGQIYCGLIRPLFIGFLLNCSGFAALLFSSIPAIRQMAFFALVSLLTGFLLAAAALPFFPGFTRPRDIHEPLEGRSREPSFFRGLVMCLALAAGLAMAFRNLDFDFHPAALGARGREIAEDSAKIRKLWGLDSAVSLVIKGESRDDALKKAAACAARLRGAGAPNVISPSDFIFPSREAAANAERWRKWIQKRDLPARLAEAGAGLGFGPKAFEPFTKALSKEPLEIEGPADLLLFGNNAVTRCSYVPDSLELDDPDLYVFAPAQLESAVSSAFKEERRLLAWAALFVTALICALCRRPARILAVLIAPAFSAGAVLAVFEIFSMPFTLAALAALPIVFGLAVDHGLMITHALETGRALGVRRAVVLASITAFFSIGLLALSDHPALRTMGLVIFSGLAGELFAALWLTPLAFPKKAAA